MKGAVMDSTEKALLDALKKKEELGSLSKDEAQKLLQLKREDETIKDMRRLARSAIIKLPYRF
jgi:hypothetical protein